MWGYCDKCSEILNDTNFKVCDFCGDYYCIRCDRRFDRAISFTDQGIDIEFCSITCIGQYIEIIVKYPDSDIEGEDC
jgi:hypothetical protein